MHTLRVVSSSIDETRAAREPSSDTTLPGGPARAEPRPATREAGSVLGRYVVLSTLGAGAMGVVYAAYDPDLDRTVAIKLLRTGLVDATSPGADEQPARTRLLREAQALAKLAHPNIVAIHDVGTVGDEVFLAMEFVAGQTLSQWLQGQQRPWREVLEVMTAAGEGLVAAHEAGLLHRDFKADNVMVGDDGRVRVMDFGLARAQRTQRAAANVEWAANVPALSAAVTQAGAIMGTPAYMAPELFMGEAATVESDQYAFAVTLWEALYRARPHTGRTIIELMGHVLDGELGGAPRVKPRVPRWLERVCRRGLATKPDQRYPSIQALLDAFARGQRETRRNQFVVGATVVALAAAGLAGAYRIDTAQEVAACEAAGNVMFEESWNEDTKRALREGLMDTNVKYASTVVDKTIPEFDKHAAAWAEARSGACMDANVHETFTSEMYDRATWCLDDRRLAFDALVRELSAADEQSIMRASTAVSSLRDVAPCRDTARLRRLPDPPRASDAISEVRTSLARARALSVAGKYEEGMAITDAAMGLAQTLEWPPLIAEAGVAQGDLLRELGRYEESEATFKDAYFRAVESGSTEVAADAAINLAYVTGRSMAKYDVGRTWVRHAQTMLTVLGEPEDSPRRILLLNNSSAVFFSAGEFEQARAEAQRVLELRQVAFGTDHPDVASSFNNLAGIAYSTGDLDHAQEYAARGVEIFEKALGSDHPDLADFLNNLASLYAMDGKLERARAIFERALEVQEAALPPDHPALSMSLANLGQVLSELGDHEQAIVHHERAREIREAGFGADHPAFAESLINLGRSHLELGHYATAESMYKRARTVLEASSGPDSLPVSAALVGLAEVALADQRAGEAVSPAQQALTIRASAAGREADVAESRFVLARALWDAPPQAGRDRERARTLAQEALDEFEALDNDDSVREVEAWLAEHPS